MNSCPSMPWSMFIIYICLQCIFDTKESGISFSWKGTGLWENSSLLVKQKSFLEYWVCVRLINSLVFSEVNYIVHESPMNYQDAQKRCKQDNGSLATFANQDDIESMKNVVSNNRWYYWKNRLERSDSSSSSTVAGGKNTNIASSKLNDTSKSGECVKIDDNGELRQRRCTGVRPFICQVPATPPGER